MSSEVNIIRSLRRRRGYGGCMNLGQVLECIKDIMEELKDNYDKDDECAQWIYRTLNSVSASIRIHSLEEGIMPASYPLLGEEDEEHKNKRAEYRTRERDLNDLIKLVEDLPCIKSRVQNLDNNCL